MLGAVASSIVVDSSIATDVLLANLDVNCRCLAQKLCQICSDNFTHSAFLRISLGIADALQLCVTKVFANMPSTDQSLPHNSRFELLGGQEVRSRMVFVPLPSRKAGKSLFSCKMNPTRNFVAGGLKGLFIGDINPCACAHLRHSAETLAAGRALGRHFGKPCSLLHIRLFGRSGSSN